MSKHQITFNNLSSYDDLNLVILERNIETSSKVKILESIPFMNSSYDFSDLYGDNCYSDRHLEYIFKIKSKDIIELEAVKTKIVNWLNNTNTKTVLKETFSPAYYYLAECQEIELEEFNILGKLKVTFLAKPFKISIQDEGNLLWDNFDFNFDILQNTKFDVVESKEITLHNIGSKKVSPIIHITNVSPITPIIIEFNNNKYILTSETTGLEPFKFIQLDKGENKIKIYGTCTIEFVFRKEVL